MIYVSASAYMRTMHPIFKNNSKTTVCFERC